MKTILGAKFYTREETEERFLEPFAHTIRVNMNNMASRVLWLVIMIITFPLAVVGTMITFLLDIYSQFTGLFLFATNPLFLKDQDETKEEHS